MSLFVQIKLRTQDSKLLKKVRALKGNEWSTGQDAVVELRKLLLQLQNRRCVYCQSPIEADGIGYRELEHILPKGASRACRLPKGHSEDFKHRRSTFGYSEFSYEPLNLAISCADCNNSKGLFDSLINRKRKPIRYPTAKRFLWFHPHFHKYSEHITLNENFTFTKRTDGGDFVIRACKLNLVESLEKRFLARAVTNVVHADGLEHAVDTIAASIRGKIYGIEQGAKALVKRFNLNMVEAETVLQTKLTDSVDADIKVREDLRRMFRVVNARPPLKS